MARNHWSELGNSQGQCLLLDCHWRYAFNDQSDVDQCFPKGASPGALPVGNRRGEIGCLSFQKSDLPRPIGGGSTGTQQFLLRRDDIKPCLLQVGPRSEIAVKPTERLLPCMPNRELSPFRRSPFLYSFKLYLGTRLWEMVQQCRVQKRHRGTR